MDLQTQDSGLCLKCNKHSTHYCVQCKNAAYCSKSCQENDWPIHRLLCASFAKFKDSARPTKHHVRAVYFPVNDSRPKLVWLHCPWRIDKDGRSAQVTSTKSFLDLKGRPPGYEVVDYNTVLQRNLSDTIFLGYHDEFQLDGSAISKSFISIDESKSDSNRPFWRGPTIAYGMVGPSMAAKTFRDLNMNDLRHIADWYTKSLWTPFVYFEYVGHIEGIRINCHGDQNMLQKPLFEKVEVAMSDLIFRKKKDVPDVSRGLGLTLFTQRCLPDARWVKDRNNTIFDRDPFTNDEAAYLHLCCDPSVSEDFAPGKSSWGSPTFPWQDNVGSVIVVREDQKALSPLTMEALCRYCRYVVYPMLQLARTDGGKGSGQSLSKAAALTKINKSTFLTSWRKLLEEKHESRQDIDATNPYEAKLPEFTRPPMKHYYYN